MFEFQFFANQSSFHLVIDSYIHINKYEYHEILAIESIIFVRKLNHESRYLPN